MLRLRSRTFVLAAGLFAPAAGLAAQQWRYPPAPKSDGGDTYFGRSVADPYRPLEDLDAPATKAWVAAENALTLAYLDGLARRDSLRERLTGLLNDARTPVLGRAAR